MLAISVKISCDPRTSRAPDATIRAMSTSGIGSGSNVPGFDVLFPNGVPSQASSTATTTSESVYQKTADSLAAWQIDYLYGTLGTSSSASLPLFTDGESVDSFAQLANQLGAIEQQQQTGSTIDTSA